MFIDICFDDMVGVDQVGVDQVGVDQVGVEFLMLDDVLFLEEVVENLEIFYLDGDIFRYINNAFYFY